MTTETTQLIMDMAKEIAKYDQKTSINFIDRAIEISEKGIQDIDVCIKDIDAVLHPLQKITWVPTV